MSPECSLLLFTLIVQSAVGAYVLQAGRGGPTVRGGAILLLAICAAMVISLFHLGSPGKAVASLRNLASSWLSREIAALLFFATTLAVGILWQRYTGRMARGLAVVGILAGLGCIFCMAKVYMLRTVPVWDHLATPLSFFATTFLLGGLLSLTLDGEGPVSIARWGLLIACVLVQLLLTTIHPVATPGLVTLAWAHRGLLVAVAVALVLATRFPSQASVIIGTSLALAGLSEALGRYLFYATYARLGV